MTRIISHERKRLFSLRGWVVKTQNYWDFFHRPIFYKIWNTTCRKLDLFPSRGEEGKKHTQLGPLERAKLNHWTNSVRFAQLTLFAQWFRLVLSKGHNWVGVFPLAWGRKHIQLLKRRFFFYFLEYRTKEKVRNPVILYVLHHRQNSLESNL
jgi:hypothetical protein